MRVIGISGSLRRDSYNTKLLLEAGRLLDEEGVELVIYEALGNVPPYDEDDDTADAPAAVADFRDAIAGADAVLFATPEYNGSVPGGLKNAVDWASRPKFEAALTNKTVAVIGASIGQFGAMWAQADLRKILGAAGARVVGDELPVTRAHERFDAEGRLLDAELFERLHLTLETLASEAVPVALAV